MPALAWPPARGAQAAVFPGGFLSHRARTLNYRITLQNESDENSSRKAA